MCMEIKRFSQGHLLGPWQEEGAEVTKCRNLPWDGYYSRGMQSSLLSLSMNWPQLCAPLTCAQTVTAPMGTALLDTRVRGKVCRHRAGGEGREARRTQLEGSRHLTDRLLGWPVEKIHKRSKHRSSDSKMKAEGQKVSWIAEDVTTGCAGVQRHPTAGGVKAQEFTVSGEMQKEIAVGSLEGQTKC